VEKLTIRLCGYVQLLKQWSISEKDFVSLDRLSEKFLLIYNLEAASCTMTLWLSGGAMVLQNSPIF
jgi:hypothetical protein